MAKGSSQSIPYGKTIALFALCVIAYLFFVNIHFAKLPIYDETLYFHWNDERLITNMDGYFYLRLAEEWAYGIYDSAAALRSMPRPEIVPPLSVLTALIHDIAGTGFMDTAFFLPPLLAGLSVFLFIIIGHSLGSISIGFSAALFSTISHVWMIRSRLGWYDTDCLNPVFFTLISLLFAWLTCARSRHTKFVALTGLVITGCVFYLWWPTGALPLLAIAVFTYTVSLLLPGQAKTEARIKLGLLSIGITFAALATTGWTIPWFPAPINQLITSLHHHILLVLKQHSSVFPEVGSIIAELGVFSLSAFIEELSGHWWITFLAVVGLLHMFWKKPVTAIYVGVPSVLFVLLSFTAGNRFIFLLVPAQSIGLGWFLIRIVHDNLLPVSKPFALSYCIGIGAVLMVPGLDRTLGSELEPIVDGNMARLFTEAGKKTTPDTKIWNQWGPGYAIQYYSRRRTLIDGGSQTPQQVYISEVPFASPNSTFSKNWMHFFAQQPNGIAIITRRLNMDTKHALAFLKRSLESKKNARAELLSLGQEAKMKWWLRFLFPKPSPLALVFTSDMLFRTVWVSKGLWDPITDTLPETPVYMFPLEETKIDREQGVYLFRNEAYPYSKIMFVTADALSHDVKRSKGPVGILIKGNKHAFMIVKEYFNNLGFRLLFVHPSNTKDFRPMVYHPYIGGAWKVE